VKTICFALLAALWAGTVAVGFASLHLFDSTPGLSLRVPPPRQKATGLWRILVIGAAECPCTTSTIEAVDMAASAYPSDTTVEVRFVGTATPSDRAYRAALGVPGVTVVTGLRAGSAETLGSMTSGQTFIFAPDGRLAFEGGVTQGRGADLPRHAVSLYGMVRRSSTVLHAAVYGCLFGGDGT